MQISGRCWQFGDAVDTDLLAPGAYMSHSLAELSAHCLEALRPDFAGAVQDGDIILAGANFGIGSSREQAGEALRHLGIRAVVARSLGGIFQRNALNLGVPALACPDLDLGGIDEFAEAKLNVAEGILSVGGRQFTTESLPDFLLAMIADGGLIPHLKAQQSGGDQINNQNEGAT
jgi:3-isopropylmalate/(R)-2-methylmalate dehydratase small subunit